MDEPILEISPYIKNTYLMGAAALLLHHDEKNCTFEIRTMIKQNITPLIINHIPSVDKEHINRQFARCYSIFRESINCTHCRSLEMGEHNHYMRNARNEILPFVSTNVVCNIILGYLNSSCLKL
jgi:hypothetical protein